MIDKWDQAAEQDIKRFRFAVQEWVQSGSFDVLYEQVEGEPFYGQPEKDIEAWLEEHKQAIWDAEATVTEFFNSLVPPWLEGAGNEDN